MTEERAGGWVRRHAAVLAALAGVFMVLVYMKIFSVNSCRADVLAAGKGRVVLVQTGSGRTALINAGSDASILRALGETLPPWNRTLSLLVLTDSSASNTGGASALALRYRIQRMLRSSMQGSAAAERGLTGIAATATYGTQGTHLTLSHDAAVDVLWPPKTPSDAHNADGTLLVRVTCGAHVLVVGEPPPRDVSWLKSAYGSTAGLRITSTTPASRGPF